MNEFYGLIKDHESCFKICEKSLEKIKENRLTASVEDRPATVQVQVDLYENKNEPINPEFTEAYRGCVERGVLNSINEVRRGDPKGGISYLHKAKLDRKRYSFL